MIQPHRAPVTPRALLPETGAVLPLEEAVSSLARRSDGAIEIVGGPGSGKTTALAHLASVTPATQGVVFLDEPDRAQAACQSAVQRVVYTASSPYGRVLFDRT
jgi:ABC-type bacteriocin/lantibiotic exporter with double-glycine peptidase domain